MAESIYLEVEENPNSEYMPLMLYEAHADAIPISQVVLDEPGKPIGVYDVTGWSSDGDGTPCPALYAPVSDSGQAVVHLVFGGDWGIRLRPEDSSEDWSLTSETQFGEPYLMLMDGGAVIKGT
ncbi:MAG: hypothetical protein O2821_08350 [Chloroflexi bacterium]|nr:hypothetical protein [Chloroflexota bacterium]MDA1228936.1 hypothetical protein [Chloroflexota bacterium]